MVNRIDIHKQYPKWGSSARYLLPSILLSPKISSFETLSKMGFVTVILYDYTEGKKLFHKDCIGLLMNPSYTFFENGWEEFMETMHTYNNFVEIVDYECMIFLLWFKIHPQFLPNLRYFFKAGQFSMLPQKLHGFLSEKERKICQMDVGYRNKFAESLGYTGEDFEGIQLESLPDRKEYCLDLTELIKKKE